MKKNLDTVEPRYNEGPRDWQNSFATSKFRYIDWGSFSYILVAITGVKKIVRYTELDFVI